MISGVRPWSSDDGGCTKTKKGKLECSYGERCYRKKPEHFEEYNHSHLNELLKGMNDEIKLPSNYQPKISKQTITEQLEIVKKFTGIQKLSESEITSPVKGSGTSNSSPSKTEKRFVAEPMPSSSSIQSPASQKGHSALVRSNRDESKETKNDSPKNERWDEHMKVYKNAASKLIKFSIKEKMETAAPYNIFLTTIKDSPNTHNERLSISFPELLDPYFGELQSSLQINFMVEFGFLLAQYSITGYKYNKQRTRARLSKLTKILFNVLANGLVSTAQHPRKRPKNNTQP